MVDLELLLTHEHFVRAVARAVVRDEADVDDVVQETYRIALSRSPQPSPSFTGWLATVARRVALGLLRTRARRERLLKDVTPGKPPPSPHEVIEREELRQRVVAAVLGLDEPYRGTVLLVYLEGLTPAEAAKRQQVSIDTIRTRLKRARARLRERLERGEDGTRVIAGLAVLAGIGTSASAAAAGGIVGAIAMGNAMKVAAVVVVATGIGAWWYVESTSSETESARSVEGPSEVVATESAPSPVEAPAPDATRAVVDAPTVASSADASASTHRTLRGRFIDEAGRPVAGVVVSREFGYGGTLASRLTALAPPDSDATCTSGADGVFEWRSNRSGPLEQNDDAIPFRGARAGFVLWNERIRLVPGPTLDIGDRTLAGAAVVAGFVRDASGTPIEDAAVAVIAPQHDDWTEGELRVYGPNVSGEVVRSDARGAFRFEHVPPGPCEVWAVAPRTRCGGSKGLDIVSGSEHLDVVVALERRQPEDTIEGVVLRHDGTPANSAQLELTTRISTLEYHAFVNTIEPDGRFVAVVPAPGPWDIEASGQRDSDGNGVVRRIMAGARHVEIRMRQAPSFTLRVRETNGDPIERVDVSIHGTDGYGLYNATLDDRGCLTLRGCIDSFIVEVSSIEHERVTLPRIDPDAIPAILDVTLERKQWMLGQVVDALGAPVRGADVYELSTPESGRIPILNEFPARLDRLGHVTETDADGKFRLDARATTCAELRIDADGFAPTELPRTAFVVGSETRVVLHSGGTIEGRLAHADGAPCVGVIVAATCGDGFPVTTRTAPDGTFRFEHRAPGRWLVRPWHKELTPDVTNSTNLTRVPTAPKFESNCRVTDGATTRVDLVLDDFASFDVAGTLRYEGAPTRPAKLEVTLAAGGSFKGDVADDGSFRVTTMNAGLGELRMLSALFGRIGTLEMVVPIEVKSDAPTRIDRTWQGGSVRGRVIGERDSMSRDVWFRGLSGDATVIARVPIAADGAFEFAWIPVGYGTLSVGQATQAIEVTPAGSDAVEIDLR